jgi:hypothetical protein
METAYKSLIQPEVPHQVIFRKINKDGKILGGKWEFIIS